MSNIVTREPFAPRRVQGYTLLYILGNGSTTIAYKAEKDGKPYCLREHRFGKINGIDNFKHHELFQREYAVLEQLNHPQIPKVYDFFEVQEGRDISLYMVQDLVPGTCLETLLTKQGVFPEQTVHDILTQLSEILKYTHSRVPPVVHRDIKPSNIMMDTEGKIYLIDFGIVQQEILKTIGGSTSFGTLGYSAPEVFAGIATPKSDLYSLGATALTLVSGIPIDQMMEGFDLRYNSKVQFANRNLQTLIDALIDANPAQRIESATQLGTYLQQIKDGKSLAVKDKSTSWFINWLASMVPTSVVRRLAQTESEVIDDARKRQLLVTAETTIEKAATPKLAKKEEDKIAGRYILMPRTSTYALGIDALRKIGKKPFTFREKIQARVEAYESGDHRLFDTWLDSSCGIAYKKGTTKFKLVLDCKQLCDLSPDFSQFYLPVKYDKIDGVELDSGKRVMRKTAKYNTLLTKAEIQEHPAWLEVVGDKALLKAYTDIVFNEYEKKYRKKDVLMGFYVGQKTAEDELRAVFVGSLNGGSNADGYYGLYSGGRFLRR